MAVFLKHEVYVKRISICLFILFFGVFVLLGCASTNAKTAIRDLQEEGFTDIHVFPTKEKVWPDFFVDKYTYVGSNVDGEIYLKDVITGDKKEILTIQPWNPKEDCSYIYSFNNDELYFSVHYKHSLDIYKYNLTGEELEIIRHINLENDYPISFSYLDEEKKCIYIEQEYERVVYCYDLYSDSPYIKKQQYEYIYDANLYPFYVFNTELGEKEVHLISKYKEHFHINDNYVRIGDNEYLTVNRCGLYKSELCILNMNTNISRFFCLKDFGYEITGLYQVNDDEYCFIVKCQNNSRVFCYFTKDMLESQQKRNNR
jgi:hypothetical protein